jgi:zinc transport system permease protein
LSSFLHAMELPFMQRALIAGLLIGLVAGYYGAFVVQRGLSFLGDGLAHAAFGGVALALLLNTEPLWVAVPFTVAVALAITWVRERTELGFDTAIGVFFSLSVALGIVFLSLKKTYTADVYGYLFGSILSVAWSDLWVTGALALATLATWRVWPRWAYATFDRELAMTDHRGVTRDDYLLSVLIAVAVVVAVKVVGIVLIAAFLVIPAASARLFTRSFASMALVSMGIGMGSSVVGLFLSYALDIPSGATVILVQSAVFFAAALRRRR